jgi:putative methyltransferase (TIGR04325 family)
MINPIPKTIDFMKTQLLHIIAHIPGVRFWIARIIFLGPRHNQHRFWGVFPTLEAAKAYVPRKLNHGFEAKKNWADFNPKIPSRDLEAVRILSDLIPNSKSLFDLGGGVGVGFYRYRALITYPEDFRWTVCELPAAIRAGEQIAMQRGENQLGFTERQQDAERVDIYHTAGALQYIENTFAQILGKLESRPAHVLVNRVPLTDSDAFFTLQHGDHAVVAYRIGNRAEFVASIQALGYELVEQWESDRLSEIILRPDVTMPVYRGFYFRKTVRRPL